MSREIPSLDGFRAISILLVLVSHAGLGHIVPGGFGVTVFFFMSGYLITTLLVKETDKYGSIDLKAFYIRRLLRLSPPLFFTLLVAYGLMFAGLIEGSFSWKALFAQSFYFHNYYAAIGGDPTAYPAGLSILWSLAVEEHYYMIYPLLLGFVILPAQHRGLYIMGMLLIAILGWRFIRLKYLGSSGDAIYVSTDTRFDSIIYGCFLALLTARNIPQRMMPKSALPMLIILAGCGLLLLLTFFYRDETFRNTWRYSLQGIALLPIFYYAIHHSNFWAFRPLNNRIMKQIGIYSYSIYLIHFVVIKALEQYNVLGASPLSNILLGAAISTAYAALVFRFVEKPFMNLKHRFTGHKKRKTASAV